MNAALAADAHGRLRRDVASRQIRLDDLREELARRDWTVPELADWLGVARSTIKRDLIAVGAHAYRLGGIRYYSLRRGRRTTVAPIRAEIAAALGAEPQTSGQIARRVGTHRRTVHYALERLEESGLARRIDTTRPRGWVTTGETR